jgi:hypothetical protein
MATVPLMNIFSLRDKNLRRPDEPRKRQRKRKRPAVSPLQAEYRN